MSRVIPESGFLFQPVVVKHDTFASYHTKLSLQRLDRVLLYQKYAISKQECRLVGSVVIRDASAERKFCLSCCRLARFVKLRLEACLSVIKTSLCCVPLSAGKDSLVPGEDHSHELVHIFEIVHMMLFLVMVMYLAQVASLSLMICFSLVILFVHAPPSLWDGLVGRSKA